MNKAFWKALNIYNELNNINNDELADRAVITIYLNVS